MNARTGRVGAAGWAGQEAGQSWGRGQRWGRRAPALRSLAQGLTAALCLAALPGAGAQASEPAATPPSPGPSPVTAPPAPPTAPPPALGGPITALAGLPGGGRLLCRGAGTGPGTLEVTDAQGQRQRAYPVGEPCDNLELSPGGARVLLRQPASVSVWELETGALVRRVPAADPRRRSGFLDDGRLLLASFRGAEEIDLASGLRTLRQPGAFGALFVSPDGQRALVGDGGGVRLVSLSDFRTLSGLRCERPCTLRAARFSRDSRGAVALTSDEVFSLIEGRPVNVVLRRTDTAALSAYPLRRGSVLVLGDRAERRDAQTGRREGVLAGEFWGRVSAWSGVGEGVLTLNRAGEVTELRP